jgi:hypothetical protein
MTDALPLLFLFLPDGYDLMPRLTVVLGVLSWPSRPWALSPTTTAGSACGSGRLLRAPRAVDVPRSPIAFYAGRRLAIFALPGIEEGKAVIREHPVVVGGARGSRVTFAGDRLRVEGTDETMQDVHEDRGARVQDGRLRLRGRWDGLFLRATAGARTRSLELRVDGGRQRHAYVGERSFWSPTVRWTTYRMSGRFHVRHPYVYATSAGATS